MYSGVISKMFFLKIPAKRMFWCSHCTLQFPKTSNFQKHQFEGYSSCTSSKTWLQQFQGSRMYVFGAYQTRKCLLLFHERRKFQRFLWSSSWNSVHAPSQGSSEGGVAHDPLKQLEGYGALRSNEGLEASPLGSDVRLPLIFSKNVKFV